MIKYIFTFILIFWLVRSVFRFFTFGLFGQSQQNRNFNDNRDRQKRPSEGNVNIDYAPKSGSSKKSSQNYKGGDYVDYEEVD
ncbi:MAG: DUF4834 domain-containing protein [Cytophagia bacterium]|nr:DUF4834 domain-containing protein [Cytophagia bacterium]